MKNKRGFTLIELLAVIVILAIIALIAVPIILNMIKQANKSAAKSAALGYIDAIEYNNGFAEIEQPGYTSIIGNDLDVTNITVKLKGKKPSSGTVTINDKGKVESASNLCFNGYAVDYDGQDAEVNGKCDSNSTPEPTIQAYNPGDEVYFDPVTTNKCDSTTFDKTAIKNGNSTCYKWRVITVGDTASNENITVQLDHNLVNINEWSDDDTGVSGPTKILSALADETTTWTRVPALNYTYDTTLGGTNTGSNYGVMSCSNGICIKQGTDTLIAGTSAKPVKARLITGEEVTAITRAAGVATGTGAENWTLTSTRWYYYYFSSSSTIGNKGLAWLLENTSENADSGATADSYGTGNNGYWTLSPVYDIYCAWRVYVSGDMDYYWYVDNNYTGARPVITMPKSVFK